MSPPNVVVVVLDTVRSDRVGCYGYDRETTPTLDAFAAGATRYDDAVAHAPWSVPSHASLFTGEYPSEHGATTIRPVLRSGPTMPELLRAAGYETYAVSPNEYVRPLTGFDRGFDAFHTPRRLEAPARLVDLLAPGINGVASDPRLRRPVERLFNAARAAGTPTVTGREGARDGWTVDRAASVLRDAGEPFFLFANLIDVHLPPSPEPAFFERFVDDELRDVPVVADERVHTFREQSMDAAGLRKLRQLYDASVRTVDERLARLLTALREADALEDSLVVLVSDHGEHLGEFDLVGHQHSVFDSVVSVPLAVQYPGQSRGRVVDEQVETRRLFHTVLDEAGVRRYPERTLAGGRPDPTAYGEFYTPMVDVDRLVWDRTVAYDPALLGERLSFVRADGHKLIGAHGTDRLFRTPERAGRPVPLEATPDRYDRLVGATPATAAGD
jgi:arylsulfatase A-like enzyme